MKGSLRHANFHPLPNPGTHSQILGNRNLAIHREFRMVEVERNLLFAGGVIGGAGIWHATARPAGNSSPEALSITGVACGFTLPGSATPRSRAPDRAVRGCGRPCPEWGARAEGVGHRYREIRGLPWEQTGELFLVFEPCV